MLDGRQKPCITNWLDPLAVFVEREPTYLVDVLWGQPIKLVQVASTSELHENQQNYLLFFEIVPCHFCGASEVQI